MNYQNNMDAYYAYAKENRRVDGNQRTKTLKWFLLALLGLLLVWAYVSFFNSDNGASVKDRLSEIETSTLDVNNIDERTLVELSSVDSKTIIPPIKKEAIGCMIGQQDKVTGLCTSTTKDKENKELIGIKRLSEEKLNTVKLNTVNKIEVSGVITNNLKLAQVISDKEEANSTTSNKNETIVLLDRVDVNISEAKVSLSTQDIPSKVKIEEQLPVDLYHLYIVAKGESMFDIAKKQYGDTGMYIKIVNANPDLSDPDNIYEGQEILLPIVNESKSYSEILNFK